MKNLFDNESNEISRNAVQYEDLKIAANGEPDVNTSKYDEILDIIQHISGASEKAKQQKGTAVDDTEDEITGADENLIQVNEDGGGLNGIDSTDSSDGSDGEKSDKTEVFVPKVSIGKIKDKIKRSKLLDKDSLKDMFFGSQNDGIETVEDNELYAGSDGQSRLSENGFDSDDSQPVLFDKQRKKRITADPENDKIIFGFEYMITPDQASDGYMLFYNEFIRRKNVRRTTFLGIISAGLLISLVFSNDYVRWLLLLICFSLIAMMWINSYNAKKDAKNSADSVKNDSYKLTFYNSRIVIEASELAGDRIYRYQPVMIRFEDINLRIIDYEDIYVLVFKKDYIYTVPKDAMTEQMNAVFKNHLSNILGEDYREYYTKHINKPSDSDEEAGADTDGDSDDMTETERE